VHTCSSFLLYLSLLVVIRDVKSTPIYFHYDALVDNQYMTDSMWPKTQSMSRACCKTSTDSYYLMIFFYMLITTKKKRRTQIKRNGCNKYKLVCFYVHFYPTLRVKVESTREEKKVYD
jgi:hypothetical protein